MIYQKAFYIAVAAAGISFFGAISVPWLSVKKKKKQHQKEAISSTNKEGVL